MPKKDILVLEDIQIVWPNFRGAASQFNTAGDRNFNIAFQPGDFTDQLIAYGWNLKLQEAKEDRDEYYTLEVAVQFKNYPPRVMKIGAITGNQVQLTGDTVELLDSTELLKVDVEISPYHWTVSGNSGVKAYLQSLWAVVYESPLELKWGPVLDSWEPGTPLFGD